MGNPGWVLPPGIGARHGFPVYRFAAKPNKAAIDAFWGRCDAIIAEWKKDHMEELPVEDAAPTDDLPIESEVNEGDPVVPKVYGFASMGFSSNEWINVLGSSEAAWTVRDVDKVKAMAPVTRLGDWALCWSPESKSAVVSRKVEKGDGEKLLDEVSSKPKGASTPRSVDDARILRIERNPTGKRQMTFTQQVLIMAKEDFKETDWVLIGPRSAPYVFTEVAKLQTGMVTRSGTWRHENGIDDHSHIGQAHELISEALELFVTVDQVDCFNLAGVESVVRVLQYHECEVKKKKEAKAPPDGGHYFRSRPRTTGGAIVDPELLRWIATKAGQDSAILKETRKAAEEAAAAKKAKAP